MRKILFVEDDPSLGEVLSERLRTSYAVTWANTCAKAREAFAKEDFDLAILDVGLPDGNGFDLANSLRAKSNLPLIFLTAQADAENRLKGYELGAQEYIPKPFLLKELLLRVDHVLRDHRLEAVLHLDTAEVRAAELLIVKKDGEKVYLTASEMKLLETLIKRAPKVVNRDEIMTEVWGLDRDLSHRTIDNMIAKIRTALGEEGEKIKTIRGKGYQWLGPAPEMKS